MLEDSVNTSTPVAEEDVRAEDSVSQSNGKASSSNSSRTIRIKAMARKAALEAEAAALGEQHKLELDEMRLKQRKAELVLRTKLRIAEAEEQVYEQMSDLLDKSTIERSPGPCLPEDSRRSQGKIEQATPEDTAPEQLEDTVTYPPQGSTESVMVELLHSTKEQHRSLMETLQLPKAELSYYAGEPLGFWEFWRAFESNVDSAGVSPAAKLTRLLHFCTGEARRVIKACSVMDPAAGYTRAKQLLKERFGNSNRVAEAWISKVTRGPPIPANEPRQLRDMADELKTCYETLVAMDYARELQPQRVLLDIVERLPQFIRHRWLRVARDNQRRGHPPDIRNLVDFVEDIAEEQNDPVFGPAAWRSKTPPQKKMTGNYSTGVKTENLNQKCYPCKNSDHKLFACHSFKDMTPECRFDFAKKERLCFNCLNKGHMTRDCKLQRTCSVDGCKMKHTKFLHVQHRQPRREKEDDLQSYPDSSTQTSGEAVSTQSHVTGAGQLKIAIPVIPVTVYNPGSNSAVDTFAMLDPGSSSSFCTEELARRLNVAGRKQTLSLPTLECANSQLQCNEVSLRVQGKMKTEMIDLPRAYTKESININPDVIRKEDISRWPHLIDLDILDSSGYKVQLLIGQDAPEH
ncbi:PREDICTED: uncharacterized protein LOC106812201 [Priapulus caudatus]|uniref:Uncharacterized protein LOC106812201 n=1 Tax=Priapulus caudatus TaxID=37621 RepID=A0ABM1EH39_PRICU|nr:PREDICTED: uncharacterized protein LOC106812201 [Priapulus caudatus]